MAEGPPEDQRDLGYYFTLAQVGFEMVVPIGLGLILDRYVWGWEPWGLIGGAVFGFVGGLTHLVLLTNRHDRQDRPGKPKGEAP